MKSMKLPFMQPCLVLLSLAAPASAQLGGMLGGLTDEIKNAIASDLPDYFQCNKNLLASANKTGTVPSRTSAITSLVWLHRLPPPSPHVFALFPITH